MFNSLFKALADVASLSLFGRPDCGLGYDEPPGPSSEVTYLDEIAGNTAAIRALLEDTLNASAAPGTPPPSAAERPAPASPGAGHPNVTAKQLGAAAIGLRAYADGIQCSKPDYWRSIAGVLGDASTSK